MNLEDLKYTNDHEWVRLKGDIAYVGITNFAQGELGDIVYVEIETLNQKIEHGDVFGTVEAVKTVSDLFMPLRLILTGKSHGPELKYLIPLFDKNGILQKLGKI